MRLRDHFISLIEAVQLEVEDRRLSTLGVKEWRATVKAIIDGVLIEAQEALRESEVRCKKQGYNGTGAMLLIDTPAYSPSFGERDIRFSFAREEEIQVTSSYPELDTRWERAPFSRAALISKVGEFLRRIVADYPERPPEHDMTVRGGWPLDRQ
jgi:hypothetical protein